MQAISPEETLKATVREVHQIVETQARGAVQLKEGIRGKTRPPDLLLPKRHYSMKDHLCLLWSFQYEMNAQILIAMELGALPTHRHHQLPTHLHRQPSTHLRHPTNPHVHSTNRQYPIQTRQPRTPKMIKMTCFDSTQFQLPGPMLKTGQLTPRQIAI